MHQSATFWGVLALGVVLAVASCQKPPGQAEFDRGLYELRRNNPVRARALLEKSIARRPGSEENAFAYNYLGIAAWKLGQFKAAQEAFEDSRRLNPTYAAPVYNLGLLHRQAGEFVQAAQMFEQAAKLDETDPRPLEMLALLYMQSRQWPLARRTLHAALNRAPNSARILTAIAVLDLQTLGPEKSIESHLIALEKDARYAPALFNVGLIYYTRLGDAQRATTYFKRFLAQKPSGPAADYARSFLQTLESRSLAQAPAAGTPVREADALGGGGGAKALAAAGPAAQPPQPATPTPQPTAPPAAPAPSRTLDQRDDELIRQSAERAERGDVSGALEMLLQGAEVAALEQRPAAQERMLRAAARIAFDDPRAHLALAEFLLANRQPAEAVRAFKQATVLAPQNVAAHLGLARAASAAGEYDAALVGYQQAVRLDPRNPDALWEMAQLLDRQLKFAERAIEAYRDFEKFFPTDPRIPRAGERIRDLSKAVRASAPEVPLPPRVEPPAPTPVPARPPPMPASPSPAAVAQPVRATQMSGDPYFGREPTPPARRLNIRPAANRDPNVAVASFNYGVECMRQRRWDQAVTAFTRAIENNPQFYSAYYNLGLVYTQLGDSELAKDAYLQTLVIKPEHVQARYNLALLYFQGRDLPSAAALATDLVRRNPRYAVAHYLLGQIYSERPETIPQAREAYSRFLELEPNHPAAAVVRHWLATH